MRRPRNLRLTLARRAAWSLVSLLAALAAGELALRLAGFSFAVAPESVEFGWPDPEQLRARYLRDPDVFWVPRDYPQRLRSLAARRPDVAMLGDSCTEFGSYPEELAERLRKLDPTHPVTVAGLGVAGWTSFQGRQQLERDVLPLRPRIITFYFGWNDHWIGFGLEDNEIHGLSRSLLGRLGDWRLCQLLFKAELTRRVRARASWPPRVSEQDFKRNLVEMARLTNSIGAVPVLLTAPASHERGKEPEHLATRWLNDKRELVPLHRRYAALVREIGAEERVCVCDLAARFDELPREERWARDFHEDGIHPTPKGHAQLADFLIECFSREPRVREALPALASRR